MSFSRKKKTQKRKPAEGAARGRPSDFSLKFWGVRGSIPAPGPETSRYGGNTPCVEVRAGSSLIILDMGTGARALGDTLKTPCSGYVLLTHYHYDHLQGIPFFTPLFDARNEFVFCGATREGRTVKDIVSGQMRTPYFPVTADMVFRARVSFQPIADGDTLALDKTTIRALEVHHPGGALAYRIDHRGRSIVYATDTEHGTESDARLSEFSRGCDVFIYDSMYTEAEYHGRNGAPSKVGWGHSTTERAVEAANAAQAKRLVLFHHEPLRTDDRMDALVRQIRKHRPETIAAKEGQRLFL